MTRIDSSAQFPGGADRLDPVTRHCNLARCWREARYSVFPLNRVRRQVRIAVSPGDTDIEGKNAGLWIPADACPLQAIAAGRCHAADWICVLGMRRVAGQFFTKRCGLLTGLALAFGRPLPAAELELKEILDRMVQMDQTRAGILGGYTCIRTYSLQNARFRKKAQMVVRVTCRLTGEKEFEILSESGSQTIRRRVFRRLLEAEWEASQHHNREEVRIDPNNYDFRRVGEESLGGRKAYVLEVTPKRASRFSIIGKIWLDAEDFAIARIEASPAKSPSIWVRQTMITHAYGKFGPFWLPVLNRSKAEALIFGPTEFQILYQSYEIRTRAGSAIPAATPEPQELKTGQIPRFGFVP
jgi:hypothetical protein